MKIEVKREFEELAWNLKVEKGGTGLCVTQGPKTFRFSMGRRQPGVAGLDIYRLHLPMGCSA